MAEPQKLLTARYDLPESWTLAVADPRVVLAVVRVAVGEEDEVDADRPQLTAPAAGRCAAIAPRSRCRRAA